MESKELIMRIALLACLLLIAKIGNGQNPEEKSLELKQLLTEGQTRFETQSKRAELYAAKNGVPISYRDSNGNLVLLVDVSPSGTPLYKTSENSGAAVTTGVDNLQINGGLGLNLEGEGMVVGVWDEGFVNHIEYEGRILSQQGTDAVHCNHVTGTIIASGLNPSSKGMAPKASAYTFDFNNDEVEMLTLAKPDQTSLLLSNHSYGLISGWHFNNNNWQWFGDISISGDEDFKFGHYSSNAAFWDRIAKNAPYYSIIKSAGNDRNNVGNGSRPPDCNGGQGYDCISDVSVAKNIITVGAVSKVLDYTGPASVQMSSFSSWGPTDDGRIKPDLVAAGVNLLSTSTSNNYTSLSGTSMASPNATGSLLLLQELYKNLNAGSVMKAATLKALAIHTTKEAGFNPGPDYRFGWGLLDVESAAKILLTQDDVNVMVKEYTLSQGEVFELILTPKSNEKISATIVWTDPAGTPTAPVLDGVDLNLVNDLDLRIIDEANQEQRPWVLDPFNPDLAAAPGDNIRDNVEKIEFGNPEPRSYKLKVSHKGVLVDGAQDFSLVLTYTAVNEPLISYYWIGGSGDFNDINHWSLSSGGPSAGSTPTETSKVIVDENSLSPEDVISITGDATIGSLTWLYKSSSHISLNGYNLTVKGGLTFVSGGVSFASAGKIIMTGELSTETKLLFNSNNLSNVDIDFNGESNFIVIGNPDFGSISLFSGNLNLSGNTLRTKKIIGQGLNSKSLDLTGTSVFGVSAIDFDFSSLELTDEGVLFESATSAVFKLGNRKINGSVIVPSVSNLVIQGSNTLGHLSVEGIVTLLSNNTLEELTLKGGSKLLLNAATVQTLFESTDISSEELKRVEISAISGTSSLNFDGRFKLCFNYLDVSNVSTVGEGIINAGLSSNLINADNWAQDECENILFPEFEIKYNCVSSLIELNDKSTGLIQAWEWSTSNPTASLIDIDKQNARMMFNSSGLETITLTIFNSNDSRKLTKQIEILENELVENQIIINGLNLFSFQSAEGYEWYRDYELIQNATERNYVYNGEPGSYFILTKNDECNRMSNMVLITDLNEEKSSYSVYPNPASDRLETRGLQEDVLTNIKIISATGLVVYEKSSFGNQTILTDGFSKGLYMIVISNELNWVTQKLVIR